MIADFAVSFASYLNAHGYSIGPTRLTALLSSPTWASIELSSDDDFIALFRLFFSSSKHEYKALPEHYHRFLSEHKDGIRMEQERKEKGKKIEEAERRKGTSAEEFRQRDALMKKELDELKEKAQQIKKSVLDNWEAIKPKVTKTEYKFLEQKKGWITSLGIKEMEQILEGKGASQEEVKRMEKSILAQEEQALRRGDISGVQDFTRLLNLLHKANRAIAADAPSKAKAVQEATCGTMAQIDELEREKAKAKREHDKVQNELNAAIMKMRREMEQAMRGVVDKDKSMNHRPEFTFGTRAVRTWTDVAAPPVAEKEFQKLSPEEVLQITDYIRENILKFKTRMNRNLASIWNGDLDMLRTIQAACRTGGMPLTLHKKQKRPGKANLVLILDVSGSCKAASSMMLTFMYLLQEVFPRGCQAYAFVNSLYDITGIMQMPDIQAAIDGVLSMIPRSGQYSNYGVPISQLWDLHKSKINNDSIVIMIGDARNNKNSSSEEQFKNIARRAKKAYWLNTDTREKWDQGDSIASTYAQYCPMFETRTTNELVTFINDQMR